MLTASTYIWLLTGCISCMLICWAHLNLVLGKSDWESKYDGAECNLDRRRQEYRGAVEAEQRAAARIEVCFFDDGILITPAMKRQIGTHQETRQQCGCYSSWKITTNKVRSKKRRKCGCYYICDDTKSSYYLFCVFKYSVFALESSMILGTHTTDTRFWI